MIYDPEKDDDDLPFSPGDEEAIIAYLFSLPPEERKRRAWEVMMNGVPKDCDG